MTSDLQDIPDGHKPFGLKTTQPLPPSVAELRDIIAAHYRGDALNQLCALASRAEPAPVADEAAIEAWERDWDAATRTLHFRIQRDEFDGVRAMGARAVRLMRAAPRNDDKLRQLREWGDLWFVHGTPLEGSRGEQAGWSVVREEIDRLLAESPAGEWVEKAHCDTIEGALKETETQLADCRDTVSAQQQTIDSVIVACGSLGLSASELPKHIEGLRARLQAAEADLAAAKSIYHGHWDDCETVAEMMRSACAEAVYQREQFKARGGIIDKLEADLAAAKAEGAKAVVEEIAEWVRGDRLMLVRSGRHVSFGTQIETDRRQVYTPIVLDVLETMANQLRSAQPQPTTAAPATVRQGDEVLRAFLDREDSCGGPTLDEQVMREVCRRLLEGKP